MWWEILKRQVASTKGKQFQLDFNQPMIEEEEDDCKRKLIAFLKKVSNLVEFEYVGVYNYVRTDFDIPYDIEEKELFGNLFHPRAIEPIEESVDEELACRIIKGILEAERYYTLSSFVPRPEPIQGVVKDIDYTIDDISPRVAAHAQFRDVPLIKGENYQDPFSTVYIYIDVGITSFNVSFASGSHKTIFDYIRRELS